jgi:hypothetical protein
MCAPPAGATTSSTLLRHVETPELQWAGLARLLREQMSTGWHPRYFLPFGVCRVYTLSCSSFPATSIWTATPRLAPAASPPAHPTARTAATGMSAPAPPVSARGGTTALWLPAGFVSTWGSLEHCAVQAATKLLNCCPPNPHRISPCAERTASCPDDRGRAGSTAACQVWWYAKEEAAAAEGPQAL